MIYFISSVAKDQSPGNKRMIERPLPESCLGINNSTNQTLHTIFPFSQDFILFIEFELLKQRQVIRLR